MRPLAGLGSRYPPALAMGQRHAAIKPRRGLERHPWAPQGLHPDKTAVQPTAFGLEARSVDLDTPRAQDLQPSAIHLGVGIRHAHHDACDPLLDEAGRAGRRPAKMAAGLEVDVGRSAAGRPTPAGEVSERRDLRMPRAAAGVIPLPDHLAIADNHAANHRVGRGGSLAMGGQGESAAHVIFVYLTNGNFSGYGV